MEKLKPVVASLDEAIQETRSLTRGQRSALRIGYLLAAGREFLNPALSVLRKTHPEVQVKLLDMSPGEQIDAMRSGDIDVALMGQEGKLVAREFYLRKLMTLPVYVVMPDNHPLSLKREVKLAELRNELFIGVPEKHVPGRKDWIVQLCRKAGFRPRFIQESDSLEHAISLVVSEGAVAILPGYAKDLMGSGIALRPISDSSAKWDFYVVWQRGRVATVVKSLIDALGSKVKPS